MSPTDPPTPPPTPPTGLPTSPPTAPPTEPPSAPPPASPPPPARGPAFVSRPRDDERRTRKPLGWWDRLKFLLLLTALFWFFAWGEMADNPLLPFGEAV